MPPSRLHAVSTAFVPLLSCVDGRLAWQPTRSIIFGITRSSAAFSKPRRPQVHWQPNPRSSSIFQWKTLKGDSSKHGNWGMSLGSVPLRDISSGGPATERLAPPAQEGRLTIDHARDVLQTLFGHDDFRDGQEGVISKLLDGESYAGIFPTGAGKSICYQLPGTIMARQGLGLTLVVSPLIALMKDQIRGSWCLTNVTRKLSKQRSILIVLSNCYQLPETIMARQGLGLTLVVSPLIALMKDQTDTLDAAGIACAKLDSTLEAREVRDIYDQIRAGGISLLYVSPERFNNERFLSALKGVKVALFVVDEAHCISEWGHNFRPDYLRLADFARATKAKARLALTATATPKVAMDIASRLGIPPPNVLRTPFYRPMLTLGAIRAPDDIVERTHLLAELLGADGSQDQGERGAAVVYVTLQKTAMEVSQMLVAAGFDARPYHAGLPSAQREETQDWFMNSQGDVSRVVVGTIAFGMGLDKKNVRRVFHFNLPRSPEDLAQQVGRAGRDGKRAFCQTLVSGVDLPLLRSMVYGATPCPAAVRGLLRIVFDGEGKEVDFNFYDISQALDTKDLVLKTLLAHLQIRGLVREVTPYFETVDVRLLEASKDTLQNGEERDMGNMPQEWVHILEMAQEALRRKRVGSKWSTLRAEDVGKALDLPKTHIARLLSGMSDEGLIELGKSGKIRARFKILRRPSSREEAQFLARDLYNAALELEAREIGRLDAVMQMLCKNNGAAVSSELSAYFGDSAETVAEAVGNENAVPASGNNERRLLSQLLAPAEVPEAEIDKLWRVGVLDLLQSSSLANENGREDDGRIIPCDDPYMLARFAAGIKSPRIAKLKLSLLGSFGCCAHCPFSALMVRAEAAVATSRILHQ